MNKSEKLSWLFTFFISGLILSGVFLAPLFYERHPILSRFIYLLYSPFCHQQPARSYFLLSHQLAVCSRCLGIYSGFFLSVILYPFWKKTFKQWINSRPGLIIIMGIPMGIDFFINLVGIWSSPLFIKTLSGFIWAAILPFFWFKATSELSGKLKVKC
jgi:uncharacterized membrane protein